jgi:hypothetical protein
MPIKFEVWTGKASHSCKPRPECATQVDSAGDEDYCRRMSREQLTLEAMALPVGERIALAEALWRSIDDSPTGPVVEDEAEAVREAARRDLELTSGAAIGRSHQEVMDTAKRALGCV